MAALCLMVNLSVSGTALAEPYLAVQQGLKCMACHVNPTGGGMRNTFGQIWGQTGMPEKHVDTGEPWTGELARFLAIGGNLRANATFTDTPHQRSLTAFDLDEARVYLDVRAIPDRLSLYVDQRIAPGGSINSEAYARLWFDNQRFYVKAGQLYLPYGIRLQDDTAFTRQVTGINFATPDRGVELGMETARWTTQLAISNGTAGGAQPLRKQQRRIEWHAGLARGKLQSQRLRKGRIPGGVSIGRRQMQNIFAGVRTGPIAWLAEADYIIDDTLVPRRKQAVGLLEANWRVRQGQNLKITAEYFDPDTSLSHDYQDRVSVVWEYTPIQFAQVRAGVRLRWHSQNDAQNRRLVFAQANGNLSACAPWLLALIGASGLGERSLGRLGCTDQRLSACVAFPRAMAHQRCRQTRITTRPEVGWRASGRRASSFTVRRPRPPRSTPSWAVAGRSTEIGARRCWCRTTRTLATARQAATTTTISPPARPGGIGCSSAQRGPPTARSCPPAESAGIARRSPMT
jgi:hypothetical protein